MNEKKILIQDQLKSNDLIESIRNYGSFDIVITSPTKRPDSLKFNDKCWILQKHYNLLESYEIEPDIVMSYKDVVRMYKKIRSIDKHQTIQYINSLRKDYYFCCYNQRGTLANYMTEMYLLNSELYMNEKNLTIINNKLYEATERNIYLPDSKDLKLLKEFN